MTQSLVLLTAVVIMELAIPRLVQRIIDQGIGGHDQGVVVRTALLMLGISLLSALFAIGNNVLSGGFYATRLYRDLRARAGLASGCGREGGQVEAG